MTAAVAVLRLWAPRWNLNLSIQTKYRSWNPLPQCYCYIGSGNPTYGFGERFCLNGPCVLQCVGSQKKIIIIKLPLFPVYNNIVMKNNMYYVFRGVSSLLPTDPHFQFTAHWRFKLLVYVYNIPEYNMPLKTFVLIFKVFPHVLCNKTLDIRWEYHKIIITSKI